MPAFRDMSVLKSKAGSELSLSTVVTAIIVIVVVIVVIMIFTQYGGALASALRDRVTITLAQSADVKP